MRAGDTVEAQVDEYLVVAPSGTVLASEITLKRAVEAMSSLPNYGMKLRIAKVIDYEFLDCE